MYTYTYHYFWWHYLYIHICILEKKVHDCSVSVPYITRVFLHPQQDVIGQNLADITHPESAVEITDNLKPAATPPTSMVEESIVSQFRQFYVRFRSTVSPSRMQLSRFTSHTVSLPVCVCGGGGWEEGVGGGVVEEERGG